MSHIKTDGTYQEIKSIALKNGDAYTDVLKAYQKQNDEYIQFFEKSEEPSLNIPAGALVVLTPDSAYNSSGAEAQEGESVAEWRNLVTGNGTPAAVQVGADDLPLMQIDPTYGRQIQFTGGSCKLGFGITSELDFSPVGTDYTIVCVCGTSTSNRTYWWANQRATNSAGGYSGFDTFGNRYYYYDGIGFTSAARTTPLIPAMVTAVRDYSLPQTRIYDNDVLLYSIDRTATKTTPPDTNFLLGSHYDGDGVTESFQLTGSLKYFMVWKRVLTDQEIVDLHAQLI